MELQLSPALKKKEKIGKKKKSRSKSGTSLWPSAHLVVFARGQTSQVTQQIAQVLFKQTGICQVLPSQVHKLVGVHHLAWREKWVKLQKAKIMTHNVFSSLGITACCTSA